MLSILLVYDEPTLRLSLGDLLEDAGYRVVRACDGDEALGFLAKDTFDLIVSDVNMPKVDGLTLLRRARIIAPGTDVLLMTAYGHVDGVVASFKLGAQDYLTKPLATDDLLDRVQRIAERRAHDRDLRLTH